MAMVHRSTEHDVTGMESLHVGQAYSYYTRLGAVEFDFPAKSAFLNYYDVLIVADCVSQNAIDS